MISVVIPTYNEAGAIEQTLRRAAMALRATGDAFELIVVDDASADGTAELAEGLNPELPVRVLRRPGKLGLASAVVHGWGKARGDIFGIMDADLQHPPEILQKLFAALQAHNADLAVASRYRPGGGTEGWSWLRRLVSWGGVRVGAAVLPWTLGNVSDSGSGMFLVRAKALEGAKLKPLGFKTLLEVLAKGRISTLVEVPYVFQGRTRGESKLGARQYVEYLIHMVRIGRHSGELQTWVYYGLAGVVGALAYVAALLGLESRMSWPLPLTLLLSIQLGVLISFLVDATVSFRRRNKQAGSQSSASRLPRYERLSLPAALVNGVVTFLLRKLGLELWMAASLGVLAAMSWNFLFVVPAMWGIWLSTTRRTVVAEKAS